jgi:hypothetical protein
MSTRLLALLLRKRKEAQPMENLDVVEVVVPVAVPLVEKAEVLEVLTLFLKFQLASKAPKMRMSTFHMMVATNVLQMPSLKRAM